MINMILHIFYNFVPGVSILILYFIYYFSLNIVDSYMYECLYQIIIFGVYSIIPLYFAWLNSNNIKNISNVMMNFISLGLGLFVYFVAMNIVCNNSVIYYINGNLDNFLDFITPIMIWVEMFFSTVYWVVFIIVRLKKDISYMNKIKINNHTIHIICNIVPSISVFLVCLIGHPVIYKNTHYIYKYIFLIIFVIFYTVLPLYFSWINSYGVKNKNFLFKGFIKLIFGLTFYISTVILISNYDFFIGISGKEKELFVHITCILTGISLFFTIINWSVFSFFTSRFGVN